VALTSSVLALDGYRKKYHELPSLKILVYTARTRYVCVQDTPRNEDIRMYCSGCGASVNDSQNFCPYCGRAAGTNYSAVATATPASAPAPATEVVQTTIRTTREVIVIESPKSPGLAAVLSFFWAGLGQIYNGEIGKGVVLMILHAISWIMIMILVGLITTPILWIYGMIDAYKTAEMINAAARVR
jgi:TM2 domain-containing membrane protein YozV